MEIYKLIQLISYGNYSKPFINYLIKYSKNNNILLYLKILKKSWIIKSEELLGEIEEGICKCTNKGLYYLLLSDKLDILLNLNKKKEFKKLYKLLKRNYDKILPIVRNIIGNGLKVNATYIEDVNQIRTWGKGYIQDNADIAIDYNVNARKLLNEGKLYEASEMFINVFKYALKHPHPTFILAGLNNAAWYLKEVDINKSLEFVKKLSFFCGFFSDEMHILINKFDTILTVLKIYKDESYFEMADIMLFYYKLLIKEEPEYKNRFIKTIIEAKKLSGEFFIEKKRSTGSLKNNKTMNIFLKQKIKNPSEFCKVNKISYNTIYPILNGVTKTIRRTVIKRIIKSLNLKSDFSIPKVINNEVLMIKEEENFEINFKKVLGLPIFRLKKMLLKGYMSLLSYKKISISKIFESIEKDKRGFYEYIKSSEEALILFNRVFSVKNYFYMGRMALIEKLYTQMNSEGDSDKYVNKLIRIYMTIEKSKNSYGTKLISLFLRNYARYHIGWNFDIRGVLKDRWIDDNCELIELFCQYLNLNPIYGYIAYWCFEEFDKRNFIKVIKNILN